MLVVIVQDAGDVSRQVVMHVDGKDQVPGQDQAALSGRAVAPVLCKGWRIKPGEHLPGAKALYQSGELEVVRSRAKNAGRGGCLRRCLSGYSPSNRGERGCPHQVGFMKGSHLEPLTA